MFCVDGDGHGPCHREEASSSSSFSLSSQTSSGTQLPPVSPACSPSQLLLLLLPLSLQLGALEVARDQRTVVHLTDAEVHQRPGLRSDL